MKSFNLYNIFIAIGLFTYGLYIFSYPPSYYNDDSLFLANGIVDFSVIDFSPHFPGYPTIIILGKFINIFVDNAKYSLFILSTCSAILIPLVLYLYVKELKDERSAFFVFLLTISSIYLLNISLSMLSESIGLFFFFLSLYLMKIKKAKLSGIVLSIAFFARPAYLILYLIGLIYLIIVKDESLKKIFTYFFITSMIFMIFIFAFNGMLYIHEAQRFILGHFNIWGTGQNTQNRWIDNIFHIANIPFIFLIFSIFKYEKRYLLLYMLFISYFIWIIFGQNPDNLRHLIPLIFIGNILLVLVLDKFKVILILLFCFNIAYLLNYQLKISPIDNIIKDIKDQNRVIFTNRSIEILRTSLPNKVFDNYYEQSSKFYRDNSSSYLITTNKPLNTNTYKVYHGRFLGEKSFYMTTDILK